MILVRFQVKASTGQSSIRLSDLVEEGPRWLSSGYIFTYPFNGKTQTLTFSINIHLSLKTSL
jgi:hypothetical protein